jgi:hypothetical protein
LLSFAAVSGTFLVITLWIFDVTVPGYTSVMLISVAQLAILSFVLFLTSFQNTKLLEIREPEVSFTVRNKSKL